MVAVLGAWLPVGCLGGDRGNHAVPPQHVLHGDRGVDRGDSAAVAQHPAKRDPLLSGHPELGPVGGHGRVDVEQTTLDQHVDAHCGNTLLSEKTSTGVSASHFRPVAWSAAPPHRSTTGRPSR